MMQPTFVCAALLALALPACRADKADKAEDLEATRAESQPESKMAQMVVYELAPGDPGWTGYVVNAPKHARVTAEGDEGARVVSDANTGKGTIDVTFLPGKTDLSELEAKLQKADPTLTFTSKSPELLEWVADDAYNFVMNMNIDGREVTCRSNHVKGVASTDDLELEKTICVSLKKNE